MSELGQNEIERNVLVCVMTEYSSVNDKVLGSGISGDDFIVPSHILCWQCINELIANDEPIDISTVRAKYVSLDSVDPLTFDDILDSYAVPDNISHYVKELQECTTKRKMIKLGVEMCSRSKEENSGELSEYIMGRLSDMTTASGYESSRVAKFSDYSSAINDYIKNPELSAGITTGWKRMDAHWKHRHGTLVIVTGIPSSGKSEWLDQIVINAIRDHKWKYAIFSPENYPLQNHFQKLAEKFVGKPMFERNHYPPMSQKERDGALKHLSEHISIITPEESGMTLDRLLNKIRLIKKKYGCDSCIIDPYNELEHKRSPKMSETEYISEFLSKLRNFGRLHNIEMILVAHPTKMIPLDNGDYRVPTLYDISGSANFRNKADVGISIWRSYQTNDGQTEVHITKVRDKNIGSIGKVVFHWDYITGAYTLAESIVL